MVGSERVECTHSSTVGRSFSLATKTRLPSQSDVNGVEGKVAKHSFLESQNWWYIRVAASWYLSPAASIPQGGALSLFISDFLAAGIRVMVGSESGKALDRRVEASL